MGFYRRAVLLRVTLDVDRRRGGTSLGRARFMSGTVRGALLPECRSGKYEKGRRHDGCEELAIHASCALLQLSQSHRLSIRTFTQALAPSQRRFGRINAPRRILSSSFCRRRGALQTYELQRQRDQSRSGERPLGERTGALKGSAWPSLDHRPSGRHMTGRANRLTSAAGRWNR